MVAFDQRDGVIFMDGEMVDWKEAKIHICTHALHYGSCVFEGERAYNGIIFKGHEHSKRLIKSGEILGIQVPMSAKELDAAKEKVIQANNIKDGYVRALAWRGSEQMGVSAQATTIHVAICTWEWPSYFSPDKVENGINLSWSKWRRPDPLTAPTDSKASGLYMICTDAKHVAEAEGYDDALMLDYRGFVAEATGANIFLVKGDEIHTPTPDCFLNGITRRTVIDMAKDMGYEVIERHIKPEDLGDFEEAFLTGTAAEVTAIGSIAEHTYTVGATVRKLRDAYAALVRSTG